MQFNDPNLILILVGTSGVAMLLAGFFSYWLNRRKTNLLLAQQQVAFAQKEKLLGEQVGLASAQLHRVEEELSELRNTHIDSQRQLGELTQQAAQILPLQNEKKEWQFQSQQHQQKASELQTQLEAQAAQYIQEQKSYQEKITLLESAEKRLQEQFENLANKIFEQKQESFTQSSKIKLDALLSPLKEQIEGFKKQVTDQYVKEGQERASLKTEILGLKELNQQITSEAAALTRALKGDNKTQGNWGEIVLEKVLKESGLREGHEYNTQVSLKNDAGKLYQPDVVVHLPNEKDVVIDSKMSLAAYERFFNEQEDSSLRESHLQEHIASVRNHIKELGKKDYQELQGIRTLDYVLMFIPIESAFLLAIDRTPELVKLALDNNIMIVSPTNLLVALRTINNVWQFEYQNQNAQNIAKKAADMYDKFVAFTTDMEGLGSSLQTVHKRYEAAMNKLTDGRGNLVKRAEEFRKLGVQSNKKLDSKLVDKSSSTDDMDEKA